MIAAVRQLNLPIEHSKNLKHSTEDFITSAEAVGAASPRCFALWVRAYEAPAINPHTRILTIR
jgi:hypothetical protein